MRLFFVFFAFVFSIQTAQASWSEIAYDKKYDELEGEDFLLALQRDKKIQVIRQLLPKFKNQISDESYSYFDLLSKLEAREGDLTRFVQDTKSISHRIAREKMHYWMGQKLYDLAFSELTNIPSELHGLEVLDLYLKLGLLTMASGVFYRIIDADQEPTYNLLNALQVVQGVDKDLYRRWLEALRISRPTEDLSNQLWIELSPKIGVMTSAQALRTYCSLNAIYCYHAAEFLRQNGSHAEAWIWAQKMTEPREYLKFKIHSLIDSQNYIGIAAIKNDLAAQGLLKEDRYAYALTYALTLQRRCQDSLEVSQNLGKNPTYRERVAKLSQQCAGTANRN